jgi:hypothetical protein
MLKPLIFSFIFLLSFSCLAGVNEFVFEPKTIAAIAPPVVNKDYFSFEFGFVAVKQIKPWEYGYNAYVTASIFQDSLRQVDHLRAGGLGFKAGVMLPTQPWVPLLFTVGLGYAKTALHRNPFLGREDQCVGRKDMFLVEPGALYRIDRYFLRFAYQLSNVKYFHRHTFLMFGVNY